MTSAALALVVLAAGPASTPAAPAATPAQAPAAPRLEQQLRVNESLAGVRLGWRVADFIAEFASKEETESLGPDARGFRRFRVLPSARAKQIDDVVVYFRDNEVMMIAAIQTVPADDAGSWSSLVESIEEQTAPLEDNPLFRRDDDDVRALTPERQRMLSTFALGDKGKTLKLREQAAWAATRSEVVAMWLEDAWAKKRTYVVTLTRTPGSPVDDARKNLLGLFTAEKAFFAEYNTYATDLVSLGFRPAAGGPWVYGFCNEFPTSSVPGIATFDPSRNHSLHAKAEADASERSRLAPLADPCSKLIEMGLADRFQVTGQSFKAFAIGNTDADTDLEVWSVDSAKSVERVRSDSE